MKAELKLEYNIRNFFFDVERPKRINKLIKIAKAQENTDEFKYETRLVDYTQKFYSKYCGVDITSEQINEIRLTWKQVNMQNKMDPSRMMNIIECENLPIVELEKEAKHLGTNEIYLCNGCNCSLFNTIERWDFYLTEMMQKPKRTPERQAEIDFYSKKMVMKYRSWEDKDTHLEENGEGGVEAIYSTKDKHQKEITILFGLAGEEFFKGKKCDMCHIYRINDSRDDPCDAFTRITLNPKIKDELPEHFRAQKYMSEPIDRDPRECLWMPYICSNGFGKDSATMIALEHSKYDEIMFIDTGSEQPETYAYINYFLNRLPSVVRHKIRIVQPRLGIIYDYYYSRKIQPTPARRDCTSKFKIRPCKAVLRHLYGINPHYDVKNKVNPEDYKDKPERINEYLGKFYSHKVDVALGINYSETDRMNSGGVWYIKNHYPLVKMQVQRRDEEYILKELNYEVPRKSGCFFCPYGSKKYWQRLKAEHPDLFKQAWDLQNNSTLRDKKFIKIKESDETNVELGCSCFNGNWADDEEADLETKNKWSM